MKIAALQIDAIASLNYESDTTIALAFELQAHGFSIYIYTTDQLSLKSGNVIAHGSFIKLHQNKENFYEVQDSKPIGLDQASLILMRQDPPFNMDYITATYLLDLVKHKALVLNDPTAVRNNVEKLLVYHLPQYIPPSLISYNITDMQEFYLEYKEVIIKPLYGHGGNDITLVKQGNNFISIAQKALDVHKHIIIQKFLPRIVEGDTRVTMLEGEILGIFRRIPAFGKVESNMAAGGTAVAYELNARELEICNAVGTLLKEKNIFFAGVDLIDGHLIEINITSPTGLRALNRIYKIKSETNVVDAIIKKLG